MSCRWRYSIETKKQNAATCDDLIPGTTNLFVHRMGPHQTQRAEIWWTLLQMNICVFSIPQNLKLPRPYFSVCPGHAATVLEHLLVALAAAAKNVLSVSKVIEKLSETALAPPTTRDVGLPF